MTVILESLQTSFRLPVALPLEACLLCVDTIVLVLLITTSNVRVAVALSTIKPSIVRIYLRVGENVKSQLNCLLV
ncbi:hypothetical protein BD311DRAFT_485843 [Dichomitus squalens]|uniref:Uncharacterized protein n=1 Tax=Dichomitus squalens TaxID=114155 RepID=A0A4Q9MIK6_9APHY|nr:hypothetical protein BD311DRAFT_485843 [Dichomitus squalens]